MNPILMLGEAFTFDVSALTSALTLSAFGTVISSLLGIVAVAVLVGFLFSLIDIESLFCCKDKR